MLGLNIDRLERNMLRGTLDRFGSRMTPRDLAALYMATAGSGGATGQVDPVALNLAQRQAVLSQSVEMIQQINSVTIAAPSAGNNVVTVNAKNVGLLKKFIVEITGTFNDLGTANSAATTFGLANLLSLVQFNDLNNNQRIQTNGLHLAFLKQVKHRTTDPGSAPIGTAQSDAMIAGEFVASGTAPTFAVIVYPLPATTASASFRAVFEIPIAYSDNDLRGAIYMNVVNAVAQLIMTLNPNPQPIAAGTDLTPSVWGGAVGTAGTITNVTVTTYQVYLDQLPVGQSGPILPFLDLATVYELKNTAFTGMVNGNDFPFPYANFRDFLSTLVVFNSIGATTGLKAGSDVNYWALQSANFTNIFKIDPLLAAQFVREIIGSDAPLGTYYFSHRKKPLSTVQYGNLQLVLNGQNITAGSAYANVYFEDFAMVNALTQAGSLAAG